MSNFCLKHRRYCDQCDGMGSCAVICPFEPTVTYSNNTVDWHIAHSCNHEKVYNTKEQYMTDPPMRDWICRKCGATGCDSIGTVPVDEYQYLIEKFKGEEESK